VTIIESEANNDDSHNHNQRRNMRDSLYDFCYTDEDKYDPSDCTVDPPCPMCDEINTIIKTSSWDDPVDIYRHLLNRTGKPTQDILDKLNDKERELLCHNCSQA